MSQNQEAQSLLALTEQEAKQWLIVAAGEVAQAAAKHPFSQTSATAEEAVTTAQPSKIEMLKAMRQYQTARASGLAARSHNPAYRNRTNWMHHVASVDSTGSVVPSEAPIGEVSSALSALSEGNPQQDTTMAINSLHEALTGYVNFERYRGERQDLIPPFIQGLSTAVENAVSTLLGNEVPSKAGPKIAIEDLQLAVMWSNFVNESVSGSAVSPLVQMVFEVAKEAGSGCTLDIAGSLLLPRLASLMTVQLNSEGRGAYADTLKSFAEAVAQSNCESTKLDDVATVASAADRICRYAVQIADTHTTEQILSVLSNGVASEDATQQAALLQMLAASAFSSFQPADAGTSITSKTEQLESDDEAAEAELRESVLQMLPGSGSEEATSTSTLLNQAIRLAFRHEWERLGRRAGDTVPSTRGAATRDVVSDCIIALDASLGKIIPYPTVAAEVAEGVTAETSAPNLALTINTQMEGDQCVFQSTVVDKPDDAEEEYIADQTETPEIADMKLVARCAVQLTTAFRNGYQKDTQVLSQMCQALLRLVKGVFKAACDCRLLDVEVAEHGNQYAFLQCLARLHAPAENPLHKTAQRILAGGSCDVFSMLVSDAAAVPGVLSPPQQLLTLHETMTQITLLVADSKINVKQHQHSAMPRVIVVNCRSASTCANAAYASYLSGARGSCLNLLPGMQGKAVIEVISPSELVGRLIDGIQDFPCNSSANVMSNPMYNVSAVVFERLDTERPDSLDAAVLQLCKSYLVYWRGIGVAHAAMLSARPYSLSTGTCPPTTMSYFEGALASALLPTFQIVVATQCQQSQMAVGKIFSGTSNATPLPPTIVATVPPLKVALLKRLFAEGPVSNELQQVLALDAAKGWADASMQPSGPLLSDPVDTTAIRQFALTSQTLSVGNMSTSVAEAGLGCCIPVERQVAPNSESAPSSQNAKFATLDVAVAHLRVNTNGNAGTNDRLSALQEAEIERKGLMVEGANLSDVVARRAEWVSKFLQTVKGSFAVVVSANDEAAKRMASCLEGSFKAYVCSVDTSLDAFVSGEEGNSLVALCLTPDTLAQLPLLISSSATPVDIVAAVDAVTVVEEGHHHAAELYVACAPWAQSCTFVSMNVTDAQLTGAASNHVELALPSPAANTTNSALHAEVITSIGASIDSFTSSGIEAKLFGGLHRTMFRHFHRRSHELFQKHVVPKLAPLVAASQTYRASMGFVRSTPPTPITDRAAITVCSLVITSVENGLEVSALPSSPSQFAAIADLDSATFAAVLAGHTTTSPTWLVSLRKSLCSASPVSTFKCNSATVSEFAAATPGIPSGILQLLTNVTIDNLAVGTLEDHSLLINVHGALRWSLAGITELLPQIRRGPTTTSEAIEMPHLTPIADVPLLLGAAASDLKPIDPPTARPRGFLKSLLSCDVYRAPGSAQTEKRESATEVWRESNAAVAAAIPRRTAGRQLKGETRSETDYRKQLQLASREVGSVPQQSQLGGWLKSALSHSYPQHLFLPISHCLQQLLFTEGELDTSDILVALTAGLEDVKTTTESAKRVRRLEVEARRVVEYVARRIPNGSAPILSGIAAAMAFMERSLRPSSLRVVPSWAWKADDGACLSSAFDFYAADQKATSSASSHSVELRPWNPLEIEGFYKGGASGSTPTLLSANGRVVSTNARTVAVLATSSKLIHSGYLPSTCPAVNILPKAHDGLRSQRQHLLARLSEGVQTRNWIGDAYYKNPSDHYPHNETGTVCPVSVPLTSNSGTGAFLMLSAEGAVIYEHLRDGLQELSQSSCNRSVAKKIFANLVHLSEFIRQATKHISAAMYSAAVHSGAQPHVFLSDAVVALKEIIDEEAVDKNESRVLALHMLRLMAIRLNRETTAAETSVTGGILSAISDIYDSSRVKCSHVIDSTLDSALMKWIGIFRPDLILETLVELLRDDETPVVANTATLKRLMKVTGRSNHLMTQATQPGPHMMLGSGTRVSKPVRPQVVLHDAALDERIQQTAAMVAKEMFEAYSDLAHGEAPTAGAAWSSYPLGAAEARRREMEVTLISTPGYSFVDPEVSAELFAYYVQLINWMCSMESDGGQVAPFQPLGDDMAYLEAVLMDMEKDLSSLLVPPPQQQQAASVPKPAAIQQHAFATITEDEVTNAVGWGEPETTGTTASIYNNQADQYNSYQPQTGPQETNYNNDDFSALLMSALDTPQPQPAITLPDPQQQQQQMHLDTESQILEMIRLQDSMAPPAAPPAHPLALHPPPMDMGTLVSNHTVGLPAGGGAVTSDTATVLVYPIPQVLFDDDEDDGGTNAMNVPLIIVKALGETLGVRVGPATIVGEVARVVVPNYNVAIRAVQVGRFICLGHRCRIIKNERIYDTSDNMRLSGRYYSYNKSTKGFESAHYPLNPSFFYDQQLFKWRREQKHRRGRVPENDEGFVFHPPRSLESRAVHLQRDPSYTGSSFTASSASNMLSSSARDYGAPAYGGGHSNQGGGYGGYNNGSFGGGGAGGGSIGFGEATGNSSW